MTQFNTAQREAIATAIERVLLDRHFNYGVSQASFQSLVEDLTEAAVLAVES